MVIRIITDVLQSLIIMTLINIDRLHKVLGTNSFYFEFPRCKMAFAVVDPINISARHNGVVIVTAL